MGQISKVLRNGAGGRLHFWCPGCNCAHGVMVDDGTRGWQWNGNADKPTFSPSILVNGDLSCPSVPRCHSFVTDGRIQFLGDCTHALAGKTVDIPPWDGGDE